MPADPLDPALEVLIAQLHLIGVLEGSDISKMARRLRECDRPDLASAVQGVIFGNAMDSPDERRAGIHAIDGGNSDT